MRTPSLFPLPKRFRNNRGIALMMTLAILAVVTLMMVAYAISMRTENVASHNFNNMIQSRQLAQAGVDYATALLRNNTPVLSSNDFWVSAPGAIYARTTAGVSTTIYLNSGTNAPAADLNSTNSVTLFPSITGSQAGSLAVNWTNIVVNGVEVGRFAFWIDDEASKVNLNTAQVRASLLGAQPTDVDLTALTGITGTDATATRTYATSYGFASREQWKAVGNPTIINNFEANRFQVTVWGGSDTNLTPWGTAKLNLNAANTVTTITNQLSDAGLSNWFGQTFADKFGATLLNQMAANIIDYHDADDDSTTDSQTDPTYAGLEKTPYLNEIILKGKIDSATSNATITADVELIFPYANGVVSKGDGYQIVADYTVTDTSGTIPGLPVTSTTNVVLTAAANVPEKSYSPTPLPVLSLYSINDITLATAAGPATIKVVFSKIRLLNSAGNLVDFSVNLTNPAPWSATTTLSVPTNNTTVSISIGNNDPRAHRAMTMVNPLTGATITLWGDEGAGTPGAQNSNFAISSSTLTDLTDDGAEPPSGGQTNHSNYYIKNANYETAGELGYIHTGLPWRSLRLQPRAAGTFIADWAVLDMFSVADAPPVGRVNINALPEAPADAFSRYEAINSIVTGLDPNSATVATNIHDINSHWVTTVSSTTWGTERTANPHNFTPEAYDMVGELCEVDQVANVVTNDASRESRIRGMVNLATVRTSTFNIWVIAQSLKDRTALGLSPLVTAETKAEAVVQRYVEGGVIKYRTLYLRYLTD